jgi:hypothetical protein
MLRHNSQLPPPGGINIFRDALHVYVKMNLNPSVFLSKVNTCSMMYAKKLFPLGMIALGFTVGSPSEAVIHLRVDQVGNDVVVTGSGKANLSALNFSATDLSFQNVLTDVQIYAGPSLFNAGQVDLYDNVLTGPSSISSDPFLVQEPDPGTSTGSLFGIQADLYRLVLPKGYISNTELTGTSTFKNVTISELGLTTGKSIWTWGNIQDGSFDSINLEVAPGSLENVPGPLPICGSSVALMWSRSLRRRITNANKK